MDGRDRHEGGRNDMDSSHEEDSTTAEGRDDNKDDDIQEEPLIYVLNLVNTKYDSTVERYDICASIFRCFSWTDKCRGAVVKAMAICTRHPFLHIYKV